MMKWHSVKECLPEAAVEVLVCCRQESHVWMKVAHFTGHIWYGEDVFSVTHWTLLPPYPEAQ